MKCLVVFVANSEIEVDALVCKLLPFTGLIKANQGLDKTYHGLLRSLQAYGGSKNAIQQAKNGHQEK